MKKVLFVDDEQRVLDGLRRMLRSMRHEWQMSFATSGCEALKILERDSYDVMVTDMRMPGMDGLELLNEVKKRHPQIVRIVLSGQAGKEMMLKSIGPMHQYLTKPCDTEIMKSTLERTNKLHGLLKDEKLKRTISEIETLPSLPDLYFQLVEEIQSDNASMRKVGEIISKDLAMTAKILHLVNSAMFGFSRNITELGQAVSLLGLDIVRILVISVHIFSVMKESDMKDFPLAALWDHGINIGTMAKSIAHAESLEQTQIDYALMGGILHDVGKLVLASNLTGQYKKVMALIKKEKITFHKAEEEVFNISHAEVGGYLLELWGLPDPVVESIVYHHNPAVHMSGVVDPVTAVHAANVFEHENNPGSMPGAQPKIDTEYTDRLGVTARIPLWQKISCEAAGKGENQ